MRAAHEQVADRARGFGVHGTLHALFVSEASGRIAKVPVPGRGTD
ncbi:hypothetical protein [Streptomyces sp. GS7]|nr:hypothetical protein [Streptomyces sp. GS7]